MYMWLTVVPVVYYFSSVMLFLGQLISPDYPSRLQQSDGCWSVWILAGVRWGSKDLLCHFYRMVWIQPPDTLRGGAGAGCGRAPQDTPLSRVVWLWFLCSSLQQAPDSSRLKARLSWTYIPGGQWLSPLQVRALDFLYPFFPSQGGLMGTFKGKNITFKEKTSKVTNWKH